MGNCKICVIGAGRWGKNHIKTLLSLNIDVGFVEKNKTSFNDVKNEFPKIISHETIKESFSSDYDGYVIATPPSTHFEIAKLIIAKNKPLLVEKPLALSYDDSKSIKLQLEKYNGILLVGHLLLFHPAIIKMKSIINKGVIGKIQYLYSNRLNLGKVRSEENVFWSFAPHDISLFQFFLNSFPKKVISMGSDILQKNIHDTTITYLKYPDNIEGHIHVSWLHPFKEHRVVIVGSKGTLHFEDTVDKRFLYLYEKDFSNQPNELELKNKAFKNIKFDSSLPLTNELKYFIDAINGKIIKKANINQGIDVIKILEMATQSLEINKD